jgi:hypothetical protein
MSLGVQMYKFYLPRAKVSFVVEGDFTITPKHELSIFS